MIDSFADDEWGVNREMRQVVVIKEKVGLLVPVLV